MTKPETLIFFFFSHSGHRLLIEFYDSVDPERRNKFPGESVNSKLSLKKTLPSLLILSGLTAGMLMTEAGRKLYVRTWIYGTLIGCLWVSIKAWAVAVCRQWDVLRGSVLAATPSVKLFPDFNKKCK